MVSIIDQLRLKTFSPFHDRSFFYQLNFAKVFVLLVLLGLTAYSNAIFHPFVHDDIVFIRNNPDIASLSQAFDLLWKPSASSGNPSVVNFYYRPLLEILYRVQYRVFGFHPQGYHFFNVILHIANSGILYALLWLLTGRKGLSFCAAVLFLLHPLQTEAVACIAGVSNLLLAFFLLLGLYLFILSDRQAGGHGDIARHALSLVLFFLALLTKEQAVIFPFLLILYVFCFPFPEGRLLKSRLLSLSGFFLLLICYAVWRSYLSAGHFNSLFAHKEELYLRFLAIPKTILMYAGLFVLPVGLHYYRSINILDPAALAFFILFFILWGVLGLVKFMPKKRSAIFIFGLGWFFIFLLPMSMAPLIIEYSIISAAEHFLYLPIIGLILCVLTVADHLFDSLGGRKGAVSLGVLGAVIVLCLLAVVRQNAFWRAEVPLFERAVRFEKNIGRVYILLGKAYYFEQRYAEAVEAYQKARVIIQPYWEKVAEPRVKNFYAGFIKDIYFDLGHCFEALGDLERSLAEYGKAAAMDPGDDILQNNLGTNYIRLGQFEMARQSFEKAVELNPNNFLALNNLAICYLQQGRRQEAEGLLRQAITVNQQFLPAVHNLKGLQSERLGRE
ncbi:MAG: tetratricopeptide repeat protein [Candidatus Omnitrophota bacterium]